MTASENTPSRSIEGVHEYDVLERDLDLGIGLSEARVQRLMSEIFVHPHFAANAFGKLSRRRGVEHAIMVLERDTLRRELTFGTFRTGLLGWRRRAVAAALRELPEALRELKYLNDRLGDVKRARHNRHVPAPVEDDEPIRRQRRRGRGR